MLRTPRTAALALFGAAALLGCTSAGDPCSSGSSGGGGDGGGGGASTLAPIIYEDCPEGITKLTGTFPTGPLEMSYATTLVLVNKADTEPGLDVEFADGGGIHVTWIPTEHTWPDPTHVGGSIRLPKAFNIPLYLGIRREFSGLLAQDLDNAKFHLVGNQLDLTGCTRAPAKTP